jgi:AraC-like DNA-binding protein
LAKVMQAEEYILNYMAAIDQEPDCFFLMPEKQEHQFPMHKHHKGQLVYIEGGMAYLNTLDKAYFIPARHYAWIPAGMEHYVQFRSPNLVVKNIYFINEQDEDHPFFSRMGIYPVSNLLLEMIYFCRKWKGNVAPEENQFLFLKTMKYLLPTISQHPLPLALPTTDSKRLEPVTRYIHDHMSGELTLPQLARETGFSVRSLSRLLQQKMNISFLQYLKLCRIIRGMELLLQTEDSVSEVAYEVGYSSLSVFSNTFKELVGVRPVEFRKLA